MEIAGESLLITCITSELLIFIKREINLLHTPDTFANEEFPNIQVSRQELCPFVLFTFRIPFLDISGLKPTLG